MFDDEDNEFDDEFDDMPDLGPCHACGAKRAEGFRTNGEGEAVRNLIMLNLKAPIPGTGWGCVVCGLPSDGAVSVICDNCQIAGNEPRYAFDGYALEHNRIPISHLTEVFIHDDEKHQMLDGFIDFDIKR